MNKPSVPLVLLQEPSTKSWYFVDADRLGNKPQCSTCLFTGAKHKKLVEQRKRKLGEQAEAEPAEKKASPDPKDSIPAVDSSAIVPFDQVGDATLGSH